MWTGQMYACHISQASRAVSEAVSANSILTNVPRRRDRKAQTDTVPTIHETSESESCSKFVSYAKGSTTNL